MDKGNKLRAKGRGSLVRLLFFALMASLLPACLNQEDYSQEEVQELMDEELERRLGLFRAARERGCNERLLERAQLIVDSILVNRARSALDTSRPARPPLPIIKKLNDTISLKPLFEPDTLSNTPLPSDSSGLIKE